VLSPDLDQDGLLGAETGDGMYEGLSERGFLSATAHEDGEGLPQRMQQRGLVAPTLICSERE
jgi:hypothetical protein